MGARILPLTPNRSTRTGVSAGLTEAECFAVARAAGHLPGAWYVQHDEDDQGNVSLSLVQNNGEPDDDAPVFLLWREKGRLRLGYGQGEFYAGLGTHADVVAIMDAIRRHLEGAAMFERWFKIRNDL